MLEDFRLKVFMEVAETGSFTKAAKTLGKSQPAISQNISELERTVGVSLFKRSAPKAKVSLTPQGRLFLHFAENILQEYGNIAAVFSASAGKTVIYADHAASDYVLPEIIEVLRTANPKMELSFTDNKESADISVTSTLYRKSGTILFSFHVSPEEHPLASAIQSLIER